MKLTDLDKEKITELRNRNKGYGYIAKQINVTRDQVRDYCLRNGMGGQRAEIVQLEKKPKACKGCGKNFIPMKDYKSATYCSEECHELFRYTRNESVGRKRICSTCGNVYEITDKWRSRKWCCQDCFDKGKENAGLPYPKKKTCIKCGKAFWTTGNGEYCSNECKTITKICKGCGREFHGLLTNKKFMERAYCNASCSKKHLKEVLTKSHEEYCERFTKIHKWRIVPITRYQGMSEDITVKCFECGKETTRKALEFVEPSKRRGCQYCCKQLSIAENVIEDWLIDKGIDYIRQFTDDSLVDKAMLRFDFAVLNQDGKPKTLIEYNGEQHYEPVEWLGGEDSFQNTRRRDNLKRKYAKEKGIPLIEISYKQRPKLCEILQAALL